MLPSSHSNISEPLRPDLQSSAFPRSAGGAAQSDPVGYIPLPLATDANGLALANGKEVPEGDYQVQLRALRTFGDETVDSDWGGCPLLTFSSVRN
jgi:hypothetical protein